MSVIGAIDQGTSCTRFLLYSTEDISLITSHEIELKQSHPQDGWVEMDPRELLETTRECLRVGAEKLAGAGHSIEEVVGVGLTNQRETTVVWDRVSGEPLYPAIVWLDGRTAALVEAFQAAISDDHKEEYRKRTGLPFSPYFSALKLSWLKDHVPAVKKAMDDMTLMAGTVDSWLIWNLTGGVNGGAFVTDVTNASRTLLMDIHTLQWDPKMLNVFGIKRECLAEIRSSAEVYGHLRGNNLDLDGKPIAGCLGDQQAALVGQACVSEGMAKNTYGTGCFMLYNTGLRPVISTHRLVTTVAFQMGPGAKPFYALEGSVAVAGAAVRWLRDNLNIIGSAKEVEELAQKADTKHGICVVPAFSGLYAPHWDPTARGAIHGLSFSTTKAEIARATLESVAWQTREILHAMEADSNIPFTQGLRVDGGMTANALLMQIQADALAVDVMVPKDKETTALGAAVAAGVGLGVWSLEEFVERLGSPYVRFSSRVPSGEREAAYEKWRLVVEMTKGWTSIGFAQSASLAGSSPSVPKLAHYQTEKYI